MSQHRCWILRLASGVAVCALGSIVFISVPHTPNRDNLVPWRMNVAFAGGNQASQDAREQASDEAIDAVISNAVADQSHAQPGGTSAGNRHQPAPPNAAPAAGDPVTQVIDNALASPATQAAPDTGSAPSAKPARGLDHDALGRPIQDATTQQSGTVDSGSSPSPNDTGAVDRVLSSITHGSAADENEGTGSHAVQGKPRKQAAPHKMAHAAKPAAQSSGELAGSTAPMPIPPPKAEPAGAPRIAAAPAPQATPAPSPAPNMAASKAETSRKPETPPPPKAEASAAPQPAPPPQPSATTPSASANRSVATVQPPAFAPGPGAEPKPNATSAVQAQAPSDVGAATALAQSEAALGNQGNGNSASSNMSAHDALEREIASAQGLLSRSGAAPAAGGNGTAQKQKEPMTSAPSPDSGGLGAISTSVSNWLTQMPASAAFAMFGGLGLLAALLAGALKARRTLDD